MHNVNVRYLLVEAVVILEELLEQQKEYTAIESLYSNNIHKRNIGSTVVVRKPIVHHKLHPYCSMASEY